MQSLEGFIRQVIGWREFIRGCINTSVRCSTRGNFWRHHRQMTDAWYSGDTGIEPLDAAIVEAQPPGGPITFPIDGCGQFDDAV